MTRPLEHTPVCHRVHACPRTSCGKVLRTDWWNARLRHLEEWTLTLFEDLRGDRGRFTSPWAKDRLEFDPTVDTS